jgi:hypothetical protein
VGRVWRWALVMVVVLAAYVFLSLPSLIYLDERSIPTGKVSLITNTR